MVILKAKTFKGNYEPIKGAISPIFSITVRSHKMHVYHWKSKNSGPGLLKWLFFHTKSVNKCVWLQMAKVETDSNLKTSGRFFEVFARLSDKIGKD